MPSLYHHSYLFLQKISRIKYTYVCATTSTLVMNRFHMKADLQKTKFIGMKNRKVSFDLGKNGCHKCTVVQAVG